jgi:hypothetical protein
MTRPVAMITKSFFLLKENYRIGVLILRDHGRSPEPGAHVIRAEPVRGQTRVFRNFSMCAKAGRARA